MSWFGFLMGCNVWDGKHAAQHLSELQLSYKEKPQIQRSQNVTCVQPEDNGKKRLKAHTLIILFVETIKCSW